MGFFDFLRKKPRLPEDQQIRNAQARNRVYRLRERLGDDERRRLDQKICAHAELFLRRRSPRAVALYWPTRGEVSALALAEAFLREGVSVLFPRVDGRGEMDFCAVAALDFDHEHFKAVKQPRPDAQAFPPEKIDAALVPVVVFGGDGRRLGHGMGCYDRFFNEKDPLRRICKVGLAYSFQRDEGVFTGGWDVRMDAIATEDGVI